MRKRIANLYKKPFQVRVHDNATTYLRTEKREGVLWLHMHRLFDEAPTPVLEAVLKFAHKKDKQALRVIRQMAELYFAENRGTPVILSKKGEVYDLDQIYQRIKAKYFGPDYDALIGWAEQRIPKKFRCITFGSYDRHRHQIRINPLLDHPEVPLYFVEFIVYHEMLHAICLPTVDVMGRTWVHTAEFKAKEKQFHHFAKAKEWEKTSLKFLRRKYGRA